MAKRGQTRPFFGFTKKSSTFPSVVWAEKSKHGLGFEIGPSYDSAPRRSQYLTGAQSSCTTILRPPLETHWRGKSKSVWSIFVKFIFDLFFQNNFPNNAQTKIDHADLNTPRRILVCRGLRPF